MRHIFWLRPNRLAGRSGPNLDPWVPRELAAAGIGAVVSVNDGLSVYAEDLHRAGIENACFPLSDNAPPQVGDFEHCLEMLPRIHEYLQAVIDKDRIPLIHCTSGKAEPLSMSSVQMSRLPLRSLQKTSLRPSGDQLWKKSPALSLVSWRVA